MKKILSMILCLTLLAGMVAVVASAAEEPNLVEATVRYCDSGWNVIEIGSTVTVDLNDWTVLDEIPELEGYRSSSFEISGTSDGYFVDVRVEKLPEIETVWAIVRYYVGDYETVAEGEGVAIKADATSYPVDSLTPPEGYVIVADAGEVYIENGYYYIDVEVEKIGIPATPLNPATVKATIRYCLVDYSVIATGDVVEISTDATSYPIEDLTTPDGYRILRAEVTAANYQWFIDVIVEEIPMVEATIRFCTEDYTLVSLGEKVLIPEDAVSYPIEDLTAPDGYRILRAEVTAENYKWFIDVIVEALPTSKTVTVHYLFNHKVIEGSFEIEVPYADTFISEEIAAANVPEGYILADADYDGYIQEDNTAYFVVVEDPYKTVTVHFILGHKVFGESFTVEVLKTETYISRHIAAANLPEGYALADVDYDGYIQEDNTAYFVIVEKAETPAVPSTPLEPAMVEATIRFCDANYTVISLGDKVQISTDAYTYPTDGLTPPDGYRILRAEVSAENYVWFIDVIVEVVSEDPETPDAPDAPEAPDAPDAPVVPEAPEAPVVPEPAGDESPKTGDAFAACTIALSLLCAAAPMVILRKKHESF